MIKRLTQGIFVLAVIAACAPAASATVTSASRPVPLPHGMATGALDNISCASNQFCVSVGSARAKHGHWRALIERWNGASWAPMRVAGGEPSPTELYGVDCLTRSDCEAVGYADTKRGYTSVIERWNGSYWAVVPHPKPAGTEIWLGAISCLRGNWCMAVGFSGNANSASHALVEHWNGTRWSIMRIDHWGGASDNQLLGVSCASTHLCFTVGLTYGGEAAVIQKWNGHTWSPSIPGDDDYSGLGSVFCLSADDCLTAGGLGDSGGAYTYLKQWNGHNWVFVESASYNDGQLYGIACSRRIRFCVAVGDNVETWTGGKNWSYRPLSSWTLNGVACARRMCMAVGDNGANTDMPTSMLVRDR